MSSVKDPDAAYERDEAFERLVAAYQTQLLRTCYLCLHDRALAEDAVQETFIKAYRSMARFRGECSERTWLMRIAINTCRDMQRTGWLRFTDRRVTPDMLPEASVPFTEEEESLACAVMSLPAKLREVVLLHYYHGMTTVEISDTLGIAQPSVSGRLKRAREKLRTALEGGNP